MAAKEFEGRREDGRERRGRGREKGEIEKKKERERNREQLALNKFEGEDDM